MFVLQSIVLVAQIVTLFYVINLVNFHSKDVPDDSVEETPIADEREEREQIADVRDELSENEIARLQRDQAFDQRINRIKAELDKSQYILRKGTVAEEGHPLVKNLPHNIIPDTRDNDPDVEYTE